MTLHFEGESSNKSRFIGRYNTMVVFMNRPSPQIPRPSLKAAIQCFEACQYNIYMCRKQIETGSVDLTWIFTQAIFMAINTMLWTLSYSEIRQKHSREEVEGHLQVALECIEVASERWPGVASALELYRNLIHACMKIFDKDGDIPISAASPSEASVTSEGINRSRTTSPATVSTVSVNTPKEKAQPAPFGYLPSQTLFGFTTQPATPSLYHSSPISASTSPAQQPRQPVEDASPKALVDDSMQHLTYDPNTQYNPLPATFAELPQWNPTFSLPQHEPYTMPPVSQALSSPLFNETYAANQGYEMTDYLYPQWSDASRGMGLNHEQQMELMQSFEANETSKLEAMIEQSNQLFSPHLRSY